MKNAEKKNQQLVTATQIAAMAGRDRRWVERKLGSKFRPGAKYVLGAVIGDLCADDPLSESDAAEITDRQRRGRAEADLSEMAMLEKAGKTIVKDDVKAALADWAVSLTKAISNTPGLSNRQREIVLDVARRSLVTVADVLEEKGD